MIRDTSPDLLIATEVAQWLRISRSTLYMWVAAGKIPSLKLNGTVRFIRADIEGWIQNRSSVPADSSPSMTRPIVAPNPSGVSRQMIHRADIRVIRSAAGQQSPQPNFTSHLVPSKAGFVERKDKR